MEPQDAVVGTPQAPPIGALTVPRQDLPDPFAEALREAGEVGRWDLPFECHLRPPVRWLRLRW